jgi:cystathionine beta-lyase/cystathionine gamma-synthase
VGRLRESGDLDRSVEAAQRRSAAGGAPNWLIRLSIGLEDPEDLAADLEQALAPLIDAAD